LIRLLHDVGKLVRHQAAASVGVRSILTGSEHQMLSDSIGIRLHGAR
jgi:hypothetical protein